jgi:ribosomal protein L11 methyltransferase
VRAFRFRARLDDDPPAAAWLWALGCRGLQQDGEDVLAWFDEPRPLPIEGRWDDPDDTDWLAAYYEGLEPVRLATLVIAPRHVSLTLEPGQRALWLDPGMAFGTGHHETTRLALARLEGLDLAGARVLDVGAGSGILAIAADLLGAAAVLGLDVDTRTVPVARANAAANGSRARFRTGTLEPDDPAQRCDVLVANLYAEALAELAEAFAAVLRPGGTALLTGILDERAARAEAALPATLEVTARDADGPWRLLVARRR